MWNYRKRTAFIVGGAVAAAAIWLGNPAQAQQEGTAELTVTVGQTLTLTVVTEELNLMGEPGDLATTTAELIVTTNNPTGYSVTVETEGEELLPTDPGNPDTIPFSDIEVETDTDGFVPLDPDNPVTVHVRDQASQPGGDTLEHDYQLEIPFVQPDSYTGTVTYTAIATA